MTNYLKQHWFSNLRGDVLAALVVALALIPEAIAFSIIAGVDPKVGLYASFCIAVITAFAGGRPGMISAATGAMALLMVTLVREHGLEWLHRLASEPRRLLKRYLHTNTVFVGRMLKLMVTGRRSGKGQEA